MIKAIRRIFNHAAEAQRRMMSGHDFPARGNKILRMAPQGDGHPVLILPGFLTNDLYTAALRRNLSKKGYKAYAWEGGFNLGLGEKTAEHLSRQLHRIFEESGGRPVTIIGHSLGGVYARELAREFPDLVRGVITLGTPFGIAAQGGEATPKHLRRIYEFFNPGSNHLDDADLHRRGLTPPPVPTTSIYSRADGVVDWRASLNPRTPLTENIEVISTHMGMLFHPHILLAVLDRLAQPEGAWQPFAAVRYPDMQFPEAAGDEYLPENPLWVHEPEKNRPLFRRPD